MKKFCKRCKLKKDTSLFYKGRGHKDGLQGICKQCNHEQYYNEHKNEYNKQYLNNARMNLHDSYIKILLRHSGIVSPTNEMVEEKRESLKQKRERLKT